MANEDYQLEELENAAVKKSNNAKRAAAAAGLFAAGSATTYAATELTGKEVPTPPINVDDMDNAAKTAASQVTAPAPKAQPATHQAAPAPKPAPEPAPAPSPDPRSPQDMVDHAQFETTTKVVDVLSGQTVGTIEEGKLNGHKIRLIDGDGDMRADQYAYDEDGNGVFNDDEITPLVGKNQIAMGHQTPEVVVKPVVLTPPPYDDEAVANNPSSEKDDEVVKNNFEDEKTDEVYKHDYAENNENYNSNARADQYSREAEYQTPEQEDEYDGLTTINDTADDAFDDLGPDTLDIV